MLNARTSILDVAPSSASAGSVQPERLSLPSNVQALLGLGLALLLVLGAVAARVAVQRRRRATAHYAALLAGSTPIGLAVAGGGPSSAGASRAVLAGEKGAGGEGGAADARRAVNADEAVRSRRTPSPAHSTAQVGGEGPRSARTSLDDEAPRSSRGGSPAAAAAPSGINVPPPSERQWQSQPPPRIGKEPPG